MPLRMSWKNEWPKREAAPASSAPPTATGAPTSSPPAASSRTVSYGLCQCQTTSTSSSGRAAGASMTAARRYPSSLAAPKMAAFASALARPEPLSTREAVAVETPARRAMSLSVAFVVAMRETMTEERGQYARSPVVRQDEFFIFFFIFCKIAGAV